MAEKKFYWIKLKTSFLTSQKVDFLMSQPDGANYVVLYQVLCLLTVNNNGELASNIGEIIVPYDEVKIQREAKWFSIDTIRCALALYSQLGLIYTQENGILKISDYDGLVGAESNTEYLKEQNRIRQQRFRDNQKLLQERNVTNNVIDNVTVTLKRNVENRDKSIENRDKNIDINTICSPEGSQGVVLDEKETMFEEFWKLYPKKSAKAKCKTSFMRIKNLKEEFSKIKEHLEYSKNTDQWKKSNGQFIPSPLTYINQERWKDVIEIPKSETKQMFDDISLDGWNINARL